MTAVAPLSTDLTEPEAREVVTRISQGLTVIWDHVKLAYLGRAWLALGYSSWDELCRAEFGSSQIRLPREERQEVVASLRESGMSTRAIAAATGVDRNTVKGDLRQVGEFHPLANANVVGLNGKSYSPPHPDIPIDAEIVDEDPEPATPQPRRRPITDTANDAGWEIRKAAEKVQRLLTDDRFRKNEEQVALSLRSHLLFVAESVATALEKLGN